MPRRYELTGTDLDRIRERVRDLFGKRARYVSGQRITRPGLWRSKVSYRVVVEVADEVPYTEMIPPPSVVQDLVDGEVLAQPVPAVSTADPTLSELVEELEASWLDRPST